MYLSCVTTSNFFIKIVNWFLKKEDMWSAMWVCMCTKICTSLQLAVLMGCTPVTWLVDSLHCRSAFPKTMLLDGRTDGHISSVVQASATEKMLTLNFYAIVLESNTKLAFHVDFLRLCWCFKRLSQLNWKPFLSFLSLQSLSLTAIMTIVPRGPVTVPVLTWSGQRSLRCCLLMPEAKPGDCSASRCVSESNLQRDTSVWQYYYMTISRTSYVLFLRIALNLILNFLFFWNITNLFIMYFGSVDKNVNFFRVTVTGVLMFLRLFFSVFSSISCLERWHYQSTVN